MAASSSLVVRNALSAVAGSVPYAVVALLAAAGLTTALELPARLLEGLDTYLLPTAEDVRSAAAAAAVEGNGAGSSVADGGERARAEEPAAAQRYGGWNAGLGWGSTQQTNRGKSKKKQQKQRSGWDAMPMHFRGLRVIQLSRSAVPVLGFFRELEQQLTILIVSLAMLAGAWILPLLGAKRPNVMAAPVASFCAVHAALVLFRCTWRGSTTTTATGGGGGGGEGGGGSGNRGMGSAVATPEVERVLSGCFGILAGAASLVSLTVLDTVLDFDVRGALRDTEDAAMRRFVGGASGSISANDTESLSDIGPSFTSRAYFIGAVVVLCAMLASSLFSAAVRTARCFALAVASPPEWAGAHVRSGMLMATIMKLDVILPVCVAALWIQPAGNAAPVLAVLAPVDAASMPAVRAVALALTGAAMIASARANCQSFTKRVLVSWYETLHATSRYTDAEVRQIEREMGMKVRVCNALLGKVALQTAAPGGILLASACIIAMKAYPSYFLNATALAASGNDDDDGVTYLIPNSMWVLLAGYVSWFTCVTISVVKMSALMLMRYGAMRM